MNRYKQLSNLISKYTLLSMLNGNMYKLINKFENDIEQIKKQVQFDLLYKVIQKLVLNKIIINAYPFIETLIKNSKTNDIKVLKLLYILNKCTLNYIENLHEKLNWLEENSNRLNITLLKNPMVPFDLTRDIDIYVDERYHDAIIAIEEINKNSRILFDIYTRKRLINEIKPFEQIFIVQPPMNSCVKILDIKNLSYIEFKIPCMSTYINVYMYIKNIINNQFITLYDLAFLLRNVTIPIQVSNVLKMLLKDTVFPEDYNKYPLILTHKIYSKRSAINKFKYIVTFLVKVHLYKKLPVYGDLLSYLLSFY